MRFLRYFVLAVASLFWAAGLSSTVYHWLYDAGLIVDDYRFGDLYRMSALPQFKLPQPNCQADAPDRSSDTARTSLYIIGDSFSEEQRLSRADFRVSHYQRARWDRTQRAQLNPTKRNVLLMETIERHFRDHFSQPVTALSVEADTNQTPTPHPVWYRQVYEDLHRSDVEERLESVLFGHNWALWFRELKARIMLNWFDRTSTGVSLSRDRRHVFLRSDTDTSAVLSSYSRLTDREVDALVDSVNATADRYRQLGFDAVYLSFIPNKASILEPTRGVYNHLIERIQAHPNLHVPIIDVYDAYKKERPAPYLKSDTHWDCRGRAIWLELVRREIGV